MYANKEKILISVYCNDINDTVKMSSENKYHYIIFVKKQDKLENRWP